MNSFFLTVCIAVALLISGAALRLIMDHLDQQSYGADHKPARTFYTYDEYKGIRDYSVAYLEALARELVEDEK